MTAETLADALEREHHQIDDGIEAFLTGLAEGRTEPAPLKDAMEALRRHIFLEEEFLFPPLRKELVAPIFVMLREHGEIWITMDEIDARLNGADGADVSEICKELLTQLERHNSKEEPIIYPQADTTLTPEARAALSAFLATGTMPAGWICEGAQRQGARAVPLPGRGR